MLSFASDPYGFVNKWLISQSRDLKVPIKNFSYLFLKPDKTVTFSITKVMQNVEGDPENERKADFYQKDWLKEGVCRYFYAKVQQRRAQLERDLGVRQLGTGSNN